MGSKSRGAVARLLDRIPEKAAGKMPVQMTRTALAVAACFWINEIVSVDGT